MDLFPVTRQSQTVWIPDGYSIHMTSLEELRQSATMNASLTIEDLKEKLNRVIDIHQDLPMELSLNESTMNEPTVNQIFESANNEALEFLINQSNCYEETLKVWYEMALKLKAFQQRTKRTGSKLNDSLRLFIMNEIPPQTNRQIEHCCNFKVRRIFCKNYY